MPITMKYNNLKSFFIGLGAFSIELWLRNVTMVTK